MRIVLFILVLLFFYNPVYATNNLSFIYINGSNNNDEKMKTWYESGVKKLHPVLKKKVIKNSTIKHYYKQIGGLDVKNEPVIFFWGDKSKKDLEFVKSRLDISKAISSSGAYIARNLITQYLHDAIWIQKPHNMIPILDELNDAVQEEAKEGNGIILYGYSAGTFITYEYLLNKLRYINPQEFFETVTDNKDFISFVKSHPTNNTCISALSSKYANIGDMSVLGDIILNQDINQLKNNYLNLDKMTEIACAPKDKVVGVVNFASPLVLFYSDISDANYKQTYYNKLLSKYIYENGIFMLTINFREDPLGYPLNRNLTIEEYEQITGLNIENPSGVIYDNSGVWSKRPFCLAHTSYWSARGTFSKAVVKSFVNGYKFQYDKKYQDKVLKHKSKKSEL